MAHIIIKQPDGLYAQYSTITDSFNIWDATTEELVEYVRTQAADRAERECLADIDDVNHDRWATLRPTWKAALKSHNERCEKCDRIKEPKKPKKKGKKACDTKAP